MSTGLTPVVSSGIAARGAVRKRMPARILISRMDKKLDPIENAGFQQTCLNCAGQR